VNKISLLVAAVSLCAAVAHTQNASAPVPPAPLHVAFAPNLKLNGTVLKTNIDCFSDRSRYAKFDVTLETLKVKYDKQVRPFPQEEIEEVRQFHAHFESPGFTDEPAGNSGKSRIGFVNDDLRQYRIASGVKSVRLKVVAAQSRLKPSQWRKVESVTFYSAWMAYPSNAKTQS
jgi:hypothetical protein